MGTHWRHRACSWQEHIFKTPILQGMLSVHAHTQGACLMLESILTQISHCGAFLQIVSLSYLNPNQQIWSISAKHRLGSKHVKVCMLASLLQASRAYVLPHYASMPSGPSSFATPGSSPAMCFLQHSKMPVTMARDQCSECIALPFSDASSEPGSTSTFCNLFEPVGQTVEIVLWKGCAEYFHRCFQPHRIPGFYQHNPLCSEEGPWYLHVHASALIRMCSISTPRAWWAIFHPDRLGLHSLEESTRISCSS